MTHVDYCKQGFPTRLDGDFLEPMSLGRHKLFIWENLPQTLHQDALLIFVDTQLDMLLKYYRY